MTETTLLPHPPSPRLGFAPDTPRLPQSAQGDLGTGACGQSHSSWSLPLLPPLTPPLFQCGSPPRAAVLRESLLQHRPPCQLLCGFLLWCSDTSVSVGLFLARRSWAVLLGLSLHVLPEVPPAVWHGTAAGLSSGPRCQHLDTHTLYSLGRGEPS